MPKNKGKGGKSFRKGKNQTTTREITIKEPGQEYAQVVKLYGGCNCDVKILAEGSGKTCAAHIRGSMRKRVWINMNDIILVSRREFEEDKYDVIHKYTHDDARVLRNTGEIPHATELKENATKEDEINFDNIEVPDEYDGPDSDEDDSFFVNRNHAKPVKTMTIQVKQDDDSDSDDSIDMKTLNIDDI